MAGVLLTKRDTFLTRAQYTQLLYAACCSSRPGADAAAAVGSLRAPPPAIWRPQPLYTGKQVGPLTSILPSPPLQPLAVAMHASALCLMAASFVLMKLRNPVAAG